jgi:hypothetical protein
MPIPIIQQVLHQQLQQDDENEDYGQPPGHPRRSASPEAGSRKPKSGKQVPSINGWTDLIASVHVTRPEWS